MEGREYEFRRPEVSVEGDTLVLEKGALRMELDLERVHTVVKTRVRAFSPRLLYIGVVFIAMGFGVFLIPYLAIAFVIGILIVLIYYTVQSDALEIGCHDATYIISGPLDELSRVRKEIDEWRVRHGRGQDVVEDRVLDDIELIERRVWGVDGEGQGNQRIEACSRCGSQSLSSASAHEGGVPGSDDISGRLECKECGFVGVPILFSSREEWELFRQGLEEG